MNLEEWKKANPGRSLNEYYAYARKNGITVESKPRNVPRSTAHNQTNGPVQENKNWMKYIISVILLIVLIATNPSESQHYNYAVNEMSSKLKQEAGNWGVLEGLKNIGSNYLSKVTITVDHRRNFLLFSIQDVNVAGEKVGSSIGCIGINHIMWSE